MFQCRLDSQSFEPNPQKEVRETSPVDVHACKECYGNEVNENITINGVLIPIYQPGKVVPYIKLDKEFEQIEGDETSTQLSIESNIKDYVIEIVECESVDKEEIHLDKDVVDLDSDGSPEVINVSTNPENLRWRISE